MTNEVDRRLGEWTQAGLLALLCYSKKHGAEVAAQVPPELFDGVHRDLAVAVIKYRNKYKGEPPGKQQLRLILERLPVQEEKLKAIKLLVAQLPKVLQGLNRDYTVKLGQDFARKQSFKLGILKAAELIGKPVVDVGQVEKVLHDTLRARPKDSGTIIRFSDVEAAAKWTRQLKDGYSLGIKPLDRAGILLRRQTQLVYLAPKNTGKSWFCVHVGRNCIMQGANVLHITLEMSADEVAKRYHQSWLAINVRQAKYLRPYFQRDKYGRATGWVIKEHTAKLFTEMPKIREVLTQHTDKWALKWDRLIIKEFSTGSLSVPQLLNFLDFLDSHENFQPDVIIIDYPDLMQVRASELRLDLGQVFKDLRGIATERNLVMINPTQVNRKGMDSSTVRGTHTAEAIDKVFTADTALTYSQTRTELGLGLARLGVEYVRDGSNKGMSVYLAQAYDIGQYVVDAASPSDAFLTKIGDESERTGDTPTDDRTPEDDKPSLVS